MEETGDKTRYIDGPPPEWVPAPHNLSPVPYADSPPQGWTPALHNLSPVPYGGSPPPPYPCMMPPGAYPFGPYGMCDCDECRCDCDECRCDCDECRCDCDECRSDCDERRCDCDERRCDCDECRIPEDGAEPAADSPEPAADSPEPAADSPEPAADSPEPAAEEEDDWRALAPAMPASVSAVFVNTLTKNALCMYCKEGLNFAYDDSGNMVRAFCGSCIRHLATFDCYVCKCGEPRYLNLLAKVIGAVCKSCAHAAEIGRLRKERELLEKARKGGRAGHQPRPRLNMRG
jgi:hypothetical protein